MSWTEPNPCPHPGNGNPLHDPKKDLEDIHVLAEGDHRIDVVIAADTCKIEHPPAKGPPPPAWTLDQHCIQVAKAKGHADDAVAAMDPEEKDYHWMLCIESLTHGGGGGPDKFIKVVTRVPDWFSVTIERESFAEKLRLATERARKKGWIKKLS